jgi:hypothetical protein
MLQTVHYAIYHWRYAQIASHFGQFVVFLLAAPLAIIGCAMRASGAMRAVGAIRALGEFES